MWIGEDRFGALALLMETMPAEKKQSILFLYGVLAIMILAFAFLFGVRHTDTPTQVAPMHQAR
jgi:hypothetical protein